MFINSPTLLFDKEFLRKLDSFPERDVYVRITSLTFDERPITNIEGNVTTGSITVDGSSAVRRTCNITLVTNNIQVNELDWALRTKFAVAVGLRNYVDNTRPDIIWFPQGIFIIQTFSATLNAQGYQIQISGKDKMCLLDGSVGGALFATHDFGKIDKRDNKNRIIGQEDVPIYQIVRNMIRTYAQEPWHNIVINDLEDCAVELIESRLSDRNVYFINGSESEEFLMYDSQMIFGESDKARQLGLETLELNDDGELKTKVLVKDGDIYYSSTASRWIAIVKVVGYHDTAGYRRTELTYAGDLIAQAGESITSVLDKIVQQLGDFEYYYDIDGRFIFQKKKTYFNATWTNTVTNDRGDSYYESSAYTSPTTYEFVGGQLVESFSNKPNLMNIRNDWSIWSTITGASGIDIPIHLRYAIDNKPIEYTSLRNGIRYVANKADVINDTDEYVDWREIIYQMAWDNLRYQSHTEALTYAIYNSYRLANWEMLVNGIKADGTLDLTSTCLELLSSNTDLEEKKIKQYLYYYHYDYKTMMAAVTVEEIEKVYKEGYFVYFRPVEWTNPDDEQDDKHLQQELIRFSATRRLDEELRRWESTWDTGYDAYYADILAFWREIYNPDMNSEEFLRNNQYSDDESLRVFDTEKWAKWYNNHYWNPEIISAEISDLTGEIVTTFIDPGMLKFWLEFIDTNSTLGAYRVSLIGRRSKVVNDNDVKAIFYRDTPGVLFIDPANETSADTMLSYIKMNLAGGYANYFVMSSQGKSAKEAMDSLVYETTYYQETVTLSVLPIYYLTPNTIIKIEDESTGIRGNYAIKSFNCSLTHNGMMSITATRVVDRII